LSILINIKKSLELTSWKIGKGTICLPQDYARLCAWGKELAKKVDSIYIKKYPKRKPKHTLYFVINYMDQAGAINELLLKKGLKSGFFLMQIILNWLILNNII